MELTDVTPHIRHWVEVYVGDAQHAVYRGTLLWQVSEELIVVNGHQGEDYRETTEPVKIADIQEIIPLSDPPWLVESNKSVAIISASAILARAQGGDEQP